jgi:hypothetical protein
MFYGCFKISIAYIDITFQIKKIKKLKTSLFFCKKVGLS